MPHGLPDQLEAIEHVDRRQQRLEQHRLGTRGDKAVAEFAQHRRIEPRVVQLQAEGIFPVDAPAHRVGGLPVREPLGELEDGRQGQLRGGDRRLARLGEEVGELRVRIDRSERVVHAQIGIPLREGGTRHLSGVLRQTVDNRRSQ